MIGVRELENVVERAVILTRGPALDLRDCLPVPTPVLKPTMLETRIRRLGIQKARQPAAS